MLPDDFDAQPVLAGKTLRIDPMLRADFEGLYRAASDPDIWAGHPARTRHHPEVFEPYFRFLLDSGTAVTIRRAGDGAIVGCSRYYPVPDVPGSVSIGFTFLTRDCWGGAVNRDLKQLMLGHAFGRVDAVWFHIDPGNARSQHATVKLGAVLVAEAELKLGDKPALWLCYRLDREAWHIGL